MYSMVLMMAVTAAPDTAACHNTYGCNGCYGAPVAACCNAPVVYSGCTGCNGCWGGCHGGGLFGRHHGCNGYSCNGYVQNCGCCGAVQSCGCCGAVQSCGCYGGAPVYGAPATVPVAPKKEMPKDGKGGVTMLPATITVNVPADAKITIDGVLTTSTEAVRVFSTPELQVGSVYYYTISAEVVRSGKTLTAVEKVAVEAGSNPTITLNPIVSPTVASK